MQSIASNPRHEWRLIHFLALSALVHAGFIFGVVLPSREAPRLLPIQLALAQPAATPTLASPRKAAPARPSSESSTPKNAPAIEPSHQTTKEAIPAPESETSASPATSAKGENTELVGEEGAQVIAQVRAALGRYFTYPVAARQRGWEGEVLLGFWVTPEGRIDHVEVVRSSGHPILDDAARASLTKVGTLPNYTARGNQPLQLQLPIIYRLEG